MTTKQQIINILTEKGQITLKELYTIIPTKDYIIRGVINQNKTIFEKVAKGTYKLRTEHATM